MEGVRTVKAILNLFKPARGICPMSVFVFDNEIKRRTLQREIQLRQQGMTIRRNQKDYAFAKFGDFFERVLV